MSSASTTQEHLATFVGIIPPLHPFALTLLLVTPSFLNDIKTDDGQITDFLDQSGITSNLQMYLDIIHVITQDADFQRVIPQLHTLLKTKLGAFYPTSPCPNPTDSRSIMSKLG